MTTTYKSKQKVYLCMAVLRQVSRLHDDLAAWVVWRNAAQSVLGRSGMVILRIPGCF